ncbi:hypothetical protein, partial [Mesorhizobium sp. M4A.F.Ca.ET.050.02.1.1]|uniref:hypothetical protein n=1 Tax=Mesorhizobium sp. M4A.F.Ca.ET.050.02.1.1 TaxID=2496754 RepID=UPI001AECD861
PAWCVIKLSQTTARLDHLWPDLKPADDDMRAGTIPVSPRSSDDAGKGHRRWLPKKKGGM